MNLIAKICTNLFLFTILFTSLAESQNLLILENTKRPKLYRYYENRLPANIKADKGHYFENKTPINLKTNKGFLYNEGIEAITDSTITLSGIRIKLNSIDYVYRKRTFLPFLEKASIMGFAAFTTAALVTKVVKGDQVFSRDLLYISGTTLGLYTISHFLKIKKIKIGKNWQLRPVLF
jgi:hypothetical protein